ncbi:hypothetical protein GOP47_0018055 [Adiantum capillus-veneris]|uniref:Uncharacterized protein n=1 Tax=Adiantum capillus-veneris TaxID=13818 RepID=A0A9D4UH20_ADICA|nr:hypothetical protein GOP47_0018055 [Adiantum capillus-veneris]
MWHSPSFVAILALNRHANLSENAPRCGYTFGALRMQLENGSPRAAGTLSEALRMQLENGSPRAAGTLSGA